MTKPLRLLFCSHNPLRRELGAPKVLIELAGELESLNWRVDFVSPTDFGFQFVQTPSDFSEFRQKLRQHLQSHSGEYDVVDYHHDCLPFARDEFSASTLMVARSVLLVNHFHRIPIPNGPGLRHLASRLLRGRRRKRELDRRLADVSTTLTQADLINVSNDDDKLELIRESHDSTKIVVIPFGLTQARRDVLHALPITANKQPVIAFVGTFDYRKGAREFPQILDLLVKKIPGVRLKLLGTQGLFATKERVLNAFPRSIHDRLEVHPTFPADQLPALLADCSAGVFPSHIEGFGFGVLEMLAAGLPVIAYDAPGPPMMLPPKWLVPRGNGAAIAAKLCELLRNEQSLLLARREAREYSMGFTWEEAAKATDIAYRAALEKL